jgi:hypothetical protein
VVLGPDEWEPLRDRHAQRVEPWIRPHLDRRRSGRRHPVEDFLFTYYSYRPAALQRWHPGYGVALVGAEELMGLKGYAGVDGAVGVTTEHVRSQQPLHEWAMVYRLSPEDVRHAGWPLRLGATGTDEVVESHRVTCSHFDAYRFFTEPARPLNTLRPGRDDRAAFEQLGCLHAGMDLYRFAFRLSPLVSSDLVADCFELARDVRVLDMRASPYDLSALGYDPVRIETPEGKQEYVEAQRGFAARGAPLRARLLAEVTRLGDVMPAGGWSDGSEESGG